MDNRPLDSLKSLASELARKISTQRDNVASIKSEMKALGYFSDQPQDASVPDNEDNLVGIWRPEEIDGETYYVRDPALRLEWYFWAKNHKIPPKSDKTRIIYMGESVARGYLYDPNFTPAALLEEVLNATGAIDAEVIDLARVNLGLDALIELTQSALALKPDAFVMYAGNNWIFTFRNSLTEAEFNEIEDAYLRDGFSGMKKVLEAKFRLRVQSFLQTVSAHGIPIIFLIPEFNLLDWKSGPMEQIIASLPDDKTEEWVQARANAEQAVAEDDWEGVEKNARLMIELDSSHPVGYELLGECALRREQWDEAREYLELGRDTGIFSRIASKARTYKIVRKTLLDEGADYGLHLVDLPTVFKEYLGGKLPGKDLFLDYCHISLEGIQVSMAPAAQQLLTVLAGQDIDWKQLIMKDIKPDNDVIAIAHFCAAVHNAHYGQSYEIIRHHCFEAVQSSPVVYEIMKHYADFITRRASTKFCQSHEELVKTGLLTQYEGGLGFLHGKDRKLMDLDLVKGIVSALQSVGIDIKDQVEELRIAEHEVPDEGYVNLLESLYQANSYDQFIKQETIYLQARDTQSPFHLIARKDSSLLLKITYRTPGRYYADAVVTVSVNGIPVAELPMSADWTTQTLPIYGQGLTDGVNKLVVSWPLIRNYTKPKKIIAFIDAMFPVIGEIHTLNVYKNKASDLAVDTTRTAQLETAHTS